MEDPGSKKKRDAIAGTPKYSFLLLVCVYLSACATWVLPPIGKVLPAMAVVILVMFSLKVVFNLRACTIAYVECKYRGLKKGEGFVSWFLDGIVDLRCSRACPFLLVTAIIIVALQCRNYHLSS